MLLVPRTGHLGYQVGETGENWGTHEKADISMEGLIRMVDGFGALIRASVSITSRFDYVYEEIIIDIE